MADVAVLLTRLQDAKLQVDFANNFLQEIQRDMQAGTVPPAEARDARERAYAERRLAVQNYRAALDELRRAPRAFGASAHT